MNFLTKRNLLGVILSLIFFQTVARQQGSSTAWYQQYFTNPGQQPIEKMLDKKANQLLEAIEIQDDSAKAHILLETGLIHLTRTYDYEKAMDFFIRSLSIADSIDDPTGRIFVHLSMARVFEEVGNYDKSLQFLEKALEQTVTINNPSILILVLSEMGKINTNTNHISEAFENYDEVLKLVGETDEPGVEAEALFHRGKLLAKQGNFEKAIAEHKKSLRIWRSLGNRIQEAHLLNAIGNVYEQMNNTERALANYQAALEVYQSLENDKGIAEAYNNIGVLYYQQGKIQLAVDTLNLALTAGRTSQSKDPVRKSYEYLSLCFKASGNFQKALEYKELFLAMNDFIQKEESDQKLVEAQSRYMLEQKETQIDRLESVRKQREKEIAEQQRIRNFLIILIALGGLVVALFLYLYILKRRSNKQLQVSKALIEQQNIELQNLNTTKDKFFSILGHDLRSPLNSLSSFSNLLINYFDSLTKEEIQTLAKDLDKSLRNLNSLLDNLLEWARSQTGNISFTPEPFDVVQVLNETKDLLQGQAVNKQITIQLESTSPVIISAHQHSITTVVRNLISNAIKFTPQGGMITLQTTRGQSETVISIADTGVGMSQEVISKLFRIDSKVSTLGTANEKGTGLGLVLCKDFVEKNGGRLWVESTEGKGTVFYFTVPSTPAS